MARRYKQGFARTQKVLLPPRLEDDVGATKSGAGDRCRGWHAWPARVGFYEWEGTAGSW